MELLVTTLKDIEAKSREYPVALGNAAALLVEERTNFVPLYMPGETINLLEARVSKARAKAGAAYGIWKTVAGEHMASLEAGMEIDVFRKDARRMVQGMALVWDSPYAYGVLLSADDLSSNPAIRKPADPQFSFEFRPKTLNLGLTGRLLQDNGGRRFQERLDLECDIYDAYELATELSPHRVVAVDNHGNQTVVYEDNRDLGKKEKLDRPDGEHVIYVFDEASRDRWGLEELQVLPTSGLQVVYSDFYEQIKKYKGKPMLFGHKYSSGRKFLEMVRVLDQHLIWEVCSFASGGIDSPLVDCERYYPTENIWGQKFPENINRLQLRSRHTPLVLGRISLYFDEPSTIQALMSLGDVVTDIWFDPVDRSMDQGWDIVYDRQRGIRPDQPVVVMNASDAEKYPVLKGD